MSDADRMLEADPVRTLARIKALRARSGGVPGAALPPQRAKQALDRKDSTLGGELDDRAREADSVARGSDDSLPSLGNGLPD